MNNAGPLSGVVVLDRAKTESGLFAGALLADMGADVVRIEDPEFDPSRISEPFLLALLRNRRVIHVGDAEQAADTQKEFLKSVAVVLVDGDDAASRAGEMTSVECLAINPALIYCSVTPFGLDGPWADHYGGDLIVQALSGFMELTGEPGRPPIRMGARVLPLMAGAEAAVALIACLFDSAHTAVNSIDMSVLDVALNTLSYMAPMYLTLGQIPGRVGSGHTTIYPYNAFAVADGYIVAAPFTQRFWRNFCTALEAPELAEDDRFRDFQRRLDNRAILEPILNARMKEKTREEWLRILDLADVPCGPVNSVAEALEMEQSCGRGLVADLDDPSGQVGRCLGFPLKITNADGSVYRPEYRLPWASEETAATDEPSSPAVRAVASTRPAASTNKPLSGVKVLDLTRMAAGPYCTQILADLGAEVIKVEEPRIGDPTRRNVPMIGELSSYFYAFNRGKKSVAVDMKTKEGYSAVRALMREADVVVENFRPGVMERLGLDYERLKKENKRVILASISGFGQTGPLREKISFDLVNQAIAGMLSITSEPGREPVRLGMAVGDLGGGLFAALGIVAGLLQRNRTGVGAHIDVSLHDVLVTLLGGIAQDYLSTGVVPGPMGSEHAHHVAEGVFATSDGWLALEAWTDGGWRQLVEEPEFGSLRDAGYHGLAERLDHRHEITRLLAETLATKTTGAWLKQLRKPGIGIAPVLNVAGALDSDHVTARQLVLAHHLPDGLDGRTIGSAFRFNGRPIVCVDGPARLGEHGAEILDGVSAA